MEPGEEPLVTAHRELIEETGFAAQTIISKGFIYTTPGYTDEKIFLFEARDLTPSQEYVKDEDEVIEVVDIAINDLAGHDQEWHNCRCKDYLPDPSLSWVLTVRTGIIPEEFWLCS